MAKINHYRNEVFEPDIIQVDEKLYIIIQKKFYSTDTVCLDIRKYIKAGRFKNIIPITLPGGETLIPTRKGLFIDSKTFETRIMPRLRALFPESKG